MPRNQALADVESHGAEGMRLWAGYLSTWTMWNHVRAAASFAAAVCFTIADGQS